jgi:nucleoside 2-deoxyribosyltransferase
MFLVYSAGELFSSKHLLGNAALANAIVKASSGKFNCVLPQTLEERVTTAHAIRDKDIFTLIGIDLALFNLDGTELDSGTVAEFMFAKFADIPCLLLRTDFRRGRDQGEDQWNLMLSFYPRTPPLAAKRIQTYKNALATGATPVEAAHDLIDQIADAPVEDLEKLIQLPPALPNELAEPVFQWLSTMPGFNSVESEQRVKAAFARKHGNRPEP